MEDPEILPPLLNGLENFDLYAIKVAGDGSCYFHAFCMACFIPYRTQLLNGKVISRHSIVKGLRRDLANNLEKLVDPQNPNSPTVYETLGNGNLAEAGLENKEFTLEALKSHLNSDEYCGEEVQELLSDETNKNIFYIDLSTRDVYISSNLDTLYKARSSVVLLYNGKDHYDTCALRNSNGEYITHFQFEHPFIQFLYQRLKVITKKY